MFGTFYFIDQSVIVYASLYVTLHMRISANYILSEFIKDILDIERLNQFNWLLFCNGHEHNTVLLILYFFLNLIRFVGFI